MNDRNNMDSTGIVNSDDPYYKNFITSHTVTYGMNGDYKINDIENNLVNTSFKLNDEEYNIKLVGRYNVYNMSVVIIILKLLKINNDKIKNIIWTLSSTPGRMDMIEYNDNLIVIDYAHTPDAVKKAIEALNKLGNVITIIGCGGNRDKSKRKIMGKIASKYSTFVLFTSDNPRYENPNDIIFDMLHELDTFNYEIEVNRKKAILKGIQKLTKGDILLILGKGHEDYQEISGVKYHFNDREIVLEKINKKI